MLHLESRQSGKKDSASLIGAALVSFLLLLAGCGDSSTHKQKRELTLEAFNDLKIEDYALNSAHISKSLEHISSADHDDSYAATHVRQYYANGEPMVWVGYAGTDERADSLVEVLERQLSVMGFKAKAFRVPQIRIDMERLRSLNFDKKNNVNTVVARLEYNLSKAFIGYTAGQRYGFVNPQYVLNRYDAREKDSTGQVIAYRNLYDVDIKRPGKNYVKEAFQQLTTPSKLCDYLHASEPSDSFYLRLLHLLHSADIRQHKKILVNMERCRWRDKQKTEDGQKYVIVNVPAFHLWAVSPDTIIDMRAACGATKTKTPLLSSKITHMQVNPEWVIPMSIIYDDVAHHGGDSSYFMRHHYYIADRKTGKRLSPNVVTPAMLRSGNYRVAQEGGAGNSLGRIIFRFPNNFSVFLHDTSSPGVFQRDNRGVSHGCVRVQRPFDLAVFMMDKDPDPELLDKLRISMGMKPETDWGREKLDELDPAVKTPRLVNSINISPRVPIYITYYTMFQTPDGSLKYYPDVYGYDEVIAKSLESYTE